MSLGPHSALLNQNEGLAREGYITLPPLVRLHWLGWGKTGHWEHRSAHRPQSRPKEGFFHRKYAPAQRESSRTGTLRAALKE